MPDPGQPAARLSTLPPSRNVAARALGVLVSLAVLSLATSVPAAASTSTSTLRAKAAAIAAKIANDDATLNALGAAYLADRAQLERSTAAARASAVVVHRLAGVVASDRRAAASAAEVAYVDAGASTDLGAYLAEKPDELVTTAAYLNSALSLLKTATQRYTHAESNWRMAFGRQEREAASARSALAEANTERADVLATLAKEQQLEQSVNGEIARLVAAQLAAQLAAKLAAERAAATAASAASSEPAGPPASDTASVTQVPPGSLASQFAALRGCESGGNYEDNTGNGYYGAYQFSLSTWEGLGERGLPSVATPAVQDAAAFLLYSRDGWSPWPACSAILGL